MKIKGHLDLFSGIGGFSLALQRAGIKPEYIGFSDIDVHANKTFKRRFPNAEELGSITDIQPKNLPKIDLITFGFPCQDLSIAGKRGGLKANRSSLFFEAIRIIRAKRPKYFIFENVKGLFSSNKGKDFDIILQSIAKCGYDGQWQLCNTRWFLPQNRERIYFVGHIRGECRPKVFPIKGKNENNVRQRTNNNILMADYRNDEGLRIRKDGVSPCLPASRNSSSEPSRMAALVVKPVITPNREKKRQNGRRFKEDGEDMFTLTKQDQHGIQINSRIRRLTPMECERLQGFPDGWTDGQSDTQRYKQCGNAISVPVAETIYRRLYGK